MLARFADYYEITAYSPSNAANFLLVQLARLHEDAESLARQPDEVVPGLLGDLFVEVRALLAGAAPILVDLAEQVRRQDGWDGTFDPAQPEVSFVKPFVLPTFAGADPVGRRENVPV